MLKKSSITRKNILSDEWYDGRIGKFTSSEIHYLCGDKFETTGCLNYVYRKVGEQLTGKSVKNDIDVEATRWGAAFEADAIKKFAKWKGLTYIVCQQLVTEEGSMFGSTPDGLIVNRVNSDDTAYDVTTVEVKCPQTYANYVSLALCRTPQDVKLTDKKYYWQVIDQMLNCECLVGYFVCYHPDFKEGNMNIVEFRKMQEIGFENGNEIKFPLVKDMAFLSDRKVLAVKKFNEIRQKVAELGVY